MKWFQHECSSKHDPMLHLLAEEFGAEGWGVYWGLLEEIGHHSDTYHIKVTGASATADQAYVDALLHGKGPTVSVHAPAGASIPMVGLGVLARQLFTTEERLLGIIEKLVALGILDRFKWDTYGLLYSSGFEQRADVYTRRRRRSTDTVRTDFEQCPDSVRTLVEHTPDSVRTDCEQVPDNVPLQHTTEQEELQNKKEEEIVKEKKLCSIRAVSELSTVYPQSCDCESPEDAVLVPSAEQCTEVCGEFRRIIREWNEHEKTRIDWVPTHGELMKLVYGGDPSRKLWLCRQALHLTGGKPDFPGLVLRALNLMLEASKKQRIQNPFGWVWSCIHGTPEGLPPWVHLQTASEEARRITAPRPPP
jgi:hypothetical protein